MTTLDTRILAVLDEVERKLFAGQRYTPGVAMTAFIHTARFFNADVWPDDYREQLQAAMYYLASILKGYKQGKYETICPDSVVITAIASKVFALWELEYTQ